MTEVKIHEGSESKVSFTQHTVTQSESAFVQSRVDLSSVSPGFLGHHKGTSD